MSALTDWLNSITSTVGGWVMNTVNVVKPKPTPPPTGNIIAATNKSVITIRPLVTPGLSAMGTPVGQYSWPHDDTNSLIGFYGKPWVDHSLLVHVPVPFKMTYREDNGTLIPITSILFHKKAAQALTNVLSKIAHLAQLDSNILKHVSHFSGSYNYRPIRGSTRLSVHAFGAALDFDAEHLPMGKRVTSYEMPVEVYDAFISEGAYWGGNFHSRPDAMHFQWAHE